VVTLGGSIVIVSVLGILVEILGTALPLFYPARARLLGEAALPESIRAEGVLGLGFEAAANDSWLVAHVVDSSGKFHFVDLLGNIAIAEADANSSAATGGNPGNEKPDKRTLLGAVPGEASTFTLRWSDGSVSLVRVVAKTGIGNAASKVPAFSIETLATIPPGKLGVPEQAVLRRAGEDSSRCAAIYGGKQIVVTRQIESSSGDKTETRIEIKQDIPAPLTAVAMDRSGTMLYAGTASGSILWWRLDDDGIVEHDVVPPSLEKRAITSLVLMLGDATLVAGDDHGGVTNWFFVKPEREGPQTPAANVPSMKREVKKLTLIRSLEPHASAVREIIASPRNRALLVRDASGATMDYTTSERQLVSLPDVTNVAFNQRGDGVAGIEDGRIKAWRVEGSFLGLTHSTFHPEASWSSLFGRVWYEGVNSPEFSWQPQGGADNEPKLSLVPLIFGTLKGTFYAMLLAVPLALGGAAYVSQFTALGVRAWVKPAIEMMAAVPSVVLGFLVGLWLAPLLQRGLVALFLFLLAVPLASLVFLSIWQRARSSPAAEKAVRGREFFVMSLLIVAGLAAAWIASGPLEQACFGGDFVRWLYKTLGVVYDQRNAILIAFGVGFLVIPTVFSLSEDALSSVPHSMTAASMALGASRWQTLWRVVLPSASPGVFAAVMIGFGRAVGETMVFLMATGNTAIIDLSPFNGMRTLSANIAEERPGAPPPGTLYRTLFLCAVILFIMTFFLNSLAEIVRQRLRKRYGRF
jgi:phosphate transport system permease protein